MREHSHDCGHEHGHHEHSHDCCGHDHGHEHHEHSHDCGHEHGHEHHEHSHDCCGHDHDHHEHSHDCGHDHGHEHHEHSHDCCGHDHDHHEQPHDCGHDHNHHAHDHEDHDHGTISLHRGNTDIAFSAYVQDSACIVTLEWEAGGNAAQTEGLVKEFFQNIAREITEQNGIIGHIKASLEINEVVMISLTDTDAMEKSSQFPTITVQAAVIALCIEKDALEQLVMAAIDSSPLFS